MRWKSSLLLFAAVAALLGESGTPLANPEVRRIGETMRCMCGCNYTLTSCNMLSCRWAEPTRKRLAAMVDQGMSEAQIQAAFVKEDGREILTKPPTEGFYAIGWAMPFIVVGLGLAAIWMFIRRFYFSRAPVAANPQDSETLARYREQIEKDLAKLD